MSTSQKLELSREIRQWIGIVLGFISMAWLVNPTGTKNIFGNIGRKIVNIFNNGKGESK